MTFVCGALPRTIAVAACRLETCVLVEIFPYSEPIANTFAKVIDKVFIKHPVCSACPSCRMLWATTVTGVC